MSRHMNFFRTLCLLMALAPMVAQFPYSLATQQKEWIAIPTLSTKVKGKFYVGIDSHGMKTKGLYIGYQEGNQQGIASTDQIEGDHVRPADWSKRFEHMQWMIRVKVADRPVVY